MNILYFDKHNIYCPFAEILGKYQRFFSSFNHPNETGKQIFKLPFVRSQSKFIVRGIKYLVETKESYRTELL